MSVPAFYRLPNEILDPILKLLSQDALFLPAPADRDPGYDPDPDRYREPCTGKHVPSFLHALFTLRLSCKRIAYYPIVLDWVFQKSWLAASPESAAFLDSDRGRESWKRIAPHIRRLDVYADLRGCVLPRQSFEEALAEQERRRLHPGWWYPYREQESYPIPELGTPGEIDAAHSRHNAEAEQMQSSMFDGGRLGRIWGAAFCHLTELVYLYISPALQFDNDYYCVCNCCSMWCPEELRKMNIRMRAWCAGPGAICDCGCESCPPVVRAIPGAPPLQIEPRSTVAWNNLGFETAVRDVEEKIFAALVKALVISGTRPPNLVLSHVSSFDWLSIDGWADLNLEGITHLQFSQMVAWGITDHRSLTRNLHLPPRMKSSEEMQKMSAALYSLISKAPDTLVELDIRTHDHEQINWPPMTPLGTALPGAAALRQVSINNLSACPRELGHWISSMPSLVSLSLWDFGMASQPKTGWREWRLLFDAIRDNQYVSYSFYFKVICKNYAEGRTFANRRVWTPGRIWDPNPAVDIDMFADTRSRLYLPEEEWTHDGEEGVVDNEDCKFFGWAVERYMNRDIGWTVGLERMFPSRLMVKDAAE